MKEKKKDGDKGGIQCARGREREKEERKRNEREKKDQRERDMYIDKYKQQ